MTVHFNEAQTTSSSFDEVYSVSDLHLGGVKGFQIFDQGELLARTVRMIAALPAGRRVALVLNGDVVDFLAEPEAKYLDVEGALDKLKRIEADAAFRSVFDALRTLVRTPYRTLVVCMGNHDVEMALPKARAFLEEALCGADAAARGRLRLVLDGTGFEARVGGARAFFVHGNEVDSWNVVDHDALRRIIRALHADRPLPRWSSNAGTQLVVDVMNDIKRRYPLVDLLKPETKPVPAVLMGLEPSILGKLSALAPLLLKKTTTGVRMWRGLLGEDENAPRDGQVELSPDAALSQLMPGTVQNLSGQQLLERASAELEAGRPALDWSRLPGSEARTLGMGGMVMDLILDRDRDENLRDALQKWLSRDETFEWSTQDDTFRELDESVGPDIDFLVAGHTHLERSLRRTNGVGHYFNSGTWVQLIQLTRAQLADRQGFAPVLAAFREGTLAALDAAKLVLRRPTVVAIRAVDGGARGVLARAEAEDELARLKELPDTARLIRR
ncbi:metallophosphoesterase [Pyxidicoccus parkwayensis]|uniref:Metallophosphoesterase n=1 Tax=Pyxidicoccus parkwayensis TaxID=2813578 RepID=A0ABX7P402_9BACT|nr:metallophosphoesterase [Pyxidicoccus parkwaysis]QSQ25176.1 metallophosphoesterase [Pyxidicoccus parkwaysis]